MTAAIPMRALGLTGAKVSALGVGGHHLGDAASFAEADRIVGEAIDGGVTFFDNCWEYNNGRSEDWMGRALSVGGRRDKIALMTKVCTHGRDAALATKMLEESLRRLRTDHLDVWQVHGVVFDDDPDLAYRKGGVLEALDAAKRAGKTRFVGFSGHRSPDVHFDMIARGYAWDTCQFPLNPFDATYRSFAERVLPACNTRGIAVLGMKPMTGKASPIQKGLVSAEEMLRYAMSLPVATTICGMESVDKLRANLKVAQGFEPMSHTAMQKLRDRCRDTAADGRFELYKVSLAFDNPQAREAHGFPLDPVEKEVKQELDHAMGTDKPR
ncbi:MAG TPA: aldo/keto reductase [Polyangiaceae bacterium]|jgi:predicted aldo/keto reductase-like oxidoreductase